MDFSSYNLKLEVNHHVATLWLNRPDKLNAISFEMWGDFIRAMEAVAANDEIRAVVIAGRGKSFCVGIDLASLGGAPDLSTASGCLQQLGHTQRCQNGISAIAIGPMLSERFRERAVVPETLLQRACCSMDCGR